MPTFFLRRIGKKTFARMSDAAFKNEILAGATEAGTVVKDQYLKTVATWDSQPEFSTKFFVGEYWMLWVGTYDPVYNFLDGGTSIRWALMSDPFEPKTHPHFIGSDTGVGEVVKRGYTVQPPRQGITAREWTRDIYILMRPEFRRIMRNAVARGTARMMKGT